MSYTDSEDLEVHSDDEPIKRGPTTAFKANPTAAKEEFEGELEDMDKKALIKMVTAYGKHELRDTNHKISMINERMSHFDKAIHELESSIKEKHDKDIKYRQMSNNPQKQIKGLESVIAKNKETIAKIEVEIEQFEKRKAAKAVEQQNAKREINKKLVKDTYKYLEKKSDPIIVKLMESFVALLRNKQVASREDVELYLKKHESLLTAMNKVNPREIKGENAKTYVDNVQGIRHQFTEDAIYHKYIPYLVFLNQTCAIVLLAVEEKELEYQIHLLEVDNKAKEKEIDEIETFDKHVDDHDIIDFAEQVKAEKEQLNLLSNHRDLLHLRLTKLVRYSRQFVRYYFDCIVEPSKLDSNILERIEKMDDPNKVVYTKREIGSLSQNKIYQKSVTRVSKDDLNSSNVGARTKFEDSKGNFS
jgi:hypothetical protein